MLSFVPNYLEHNLSTSHQNVNKIALPYENVNKSLVIEIRRLDRLENIKSYILESSMQGLDHVIMSEYEG